MSAIKLKNLKQTVVSGVTQPLSIGGVASDNSDEVINIASNGDLTLKKSIANPIFTGLIDNQGGQIKFPATQVPSSDPNTLDDYEEGTWTPTTPTANLTLVVNEAKYTRVGRLVVANCYLTIGNSSASPISSYRINGLPFISNGYGYASQYFEGGYGVGYTEAANNYALFSQNLAVGQNLRMIQFIYHTF